MGKPAAKEGDKIKATDIHIVMVQVPAGQPVPTPMPHEFSGIINDNLSSDVKIMGFPAATVGSTAENKPPHIPKSPKDSFQNPPSNKGEIQEGSSTVKINRKKAARNEDKAITCNDPIDQLVGEVVVEKKGTVFIG